MSKIYKGYVVDRDGCYYVQLPDRNQWGFSLFSDDQVFPGGFGIGEWEAVPEGQVPNDIKERLGWILKEYEEN